MRYTLNQFLLQTNGTEPLYRERLREHVIEARGQCLLLVHRLGHAGCCHELGPAGLGQSDALVQSPYFLDGFVAVHQRHLALDEDEGEARRVLLFECLLDLLEGAGAVDLSNQIIFVVFVPQNNEEALNDAEVLDVIVDYQNFAAAVFFVDEGLRETHTRFHVTIEVSGFLAQMLSWALFWPIFLQLLGNRVVESVDFAELLIV